MPSADGKTFKTYSPNYPELVDKLSSKGVSIVAAPQEDKMPSLLGILLSWFPMLLLIGVWIFFMRQMQGGKGGAMGFGRSKAKLLNEAQGKVTFNDVAGVEEASSTPATSLKVTLPCASFKSFAFDLPNPIAPPLPPCI